MISLAEDMLAKAVKKVRGKQPDWKADRLHGDDWAKISKEMIAVLDEMREHGSAKPLAALQELAFEKSLEPGAETNKPLQTVALWLTDSRIRIEQYTSESSFRGNPMPLEGMTVARRGQRKLLEDRGLMKRQKVDGDGPQNVL